MRVGIIGSAGRGDDGAKINLTLLNRLEHMLCEWVYDQEKIAKVTTVVSGGAAFVDWLGSSLVFTFLNNRNEFANSKLSLYLPAPFDTINEKFIENKSFRFDAGVMSNFYHRQFILRTGISSLKDMADWIKDEKTTKTTVLSGFKSRNTAIAKNCDVLIAATFGNGAKLKSGGSADTMRKFLELHPDNVDKSYHLDLNTLKYYQGAIVS